MSVNDPEKLYFYFNFLELNEGLIYIEGSSHCQSNVMGNHSALRNSLVIALKKSLLYVVLVLHEVFHRTRKEEILRRLLQKWKRSEDSVAME